MTTDLEKQFFDTFGIEPKKGCTAYDKFTEEEADIICNDRCRACLYFDDVYPQISDRILLELICILRTSDALLPIFCSNNIEELKLEILSDIIRIQSRVDVKPQVQALFSERGG